MEETVTKIIAKAISNHVFPGCVVGMVRPDGTRVIIPYGYYTYDDNPPPVLADSVFDVASVTKSIPTSSLALKLIEENRLHLEDKVITYIPELNNSDKDEITIFHLLTQTLDYNFRLSQQKDKSPDEILNLIFSTEFKAKPGTTFYYSNATSILLGLIVSRIYGKPLDEVANEVFFKPLQMSDTTFYPDKKLISRVVPTEYDEWRAQLIQGEVHDESAYTLREKMVVGSAGLFSTVPDLLIFLEMLLNNGTYQGKQFFKSATVENMYTNQLLHLDVHAGLGWELNQKLYMGELCSESTFGKRGFTGCSVVCDVTRDIGIVFLSNFIHPKRRINTELNEVRRAICDAVFTSIKN